MADERIIYETADGVAIIVPSSTIDAALKDVPVGVDYEIVELADIPTDRAFRNAWRKNGAAIRTDMTDAKLIAHANRRHARAEKFKPLDVEATIPAKSAVAEQARQKVRNDDATLQTNIDNAQTESELKSLMK